MRFLTLTILLFFNTQLWAVVCGLPATIGGVSYCPANPSFQTCSVDVPDATGVLEPRYFCLSEPTAVEQANAVFMFHGGGHTGKAVAKHWQNQMADAFIVLPSSKHVGGKRKWNIVDELVPNFIDLKTVRGHSDTEFIRQVLIDLEAIYDCDQAAPPVPCIKQYYAAGFSSGAGMVFQLSTRNYFSNWFSGYGAVGNAIKEQMRQPAVAGTGNLTEPKRPVPMYFMTGTDERVHLPINYIEDVISTGCPQPDFIDNSIDCFGAISIKNIPSRRMDSGRWLRQTNLTMNTSITAHHDQSTDDTVIATQLYEPDPLLPGGKAILVGSVINGGHYWPSINTSKPDPMHSEDFETSDQMVAFWIDYAGY